MKKYSWSIFIILFFLSFTHPSALVLLPFSLLFLLPYIPFRFKSSFLRFIIIFCCGITVELFAWTSNFLAQTSGPALFHPILAFNMLYALGYYAGFALGWNIVSKLFGFSFKEVIVVTMLYAIFTEQLGAVFLSFNIIFWLYVASIYLFMSIPGFYLVPSQKKLSRKWWHYFVSLIIIFFFAWLFTALVSLPFLDVIPEKPEFANF